jgi:catechol 2,3-dioxygenase-like lactoylglutathione lyase family enzyme
MPLPDTATPLGFIMTTDRARAVAFYRDIMGFRLLAEDPFAATFDMRGLTVRLSDTGDLAPSPHPVLGWTVKGIHAAVRDLAARGVAFIHYPGMGQDADGVWTSPDGAAAVAFFADPDGNLLSLTETR